MHMYKFYVYVMTDNKKENWDRLMKSVPSRLWRCTGDIVFGEPAGDAPDRS